jgi:NADPH-dependent curcumin reductase CurA
VAPVIPATVREVFLARTPHGVPEPGHFGIREAALPEPLPGQLLCETEYLSLDPYMRGQIAGRHISGSVAPGDTLLGESVSRVLLSRADGFRTGDRVRGFSGWRTHSLLEARDVEKLPADHPQPSLALSSLGMPGLTAWAGLRCQAKPKSGETVLISAATGAVGSVAAQLARSMGCRVIGIAGSDRKCLLAKEALGYSDCINRRGADLGEALRACCPGGIDVYFDLVGGDILSTVSEQLAIGARIILCGLMADYNGEQRTPGPYPGLWIRARATVFGLVVYDFEDRRQAFLDDVLPLLRSGELHTQEDIATGIEQAPEAFCRLMRGENIGKSLVYLGHGNRR